MFGHTQCKDGMECVRAGVIHIREGDEALGYCVVRADEGKMCGEWNRVACAEGTFCVDGTCVKRKEKPPVKARFSGLVDSCRNRTCARGLECSNEPWGKSDPTCSLPQKLRNCESFASTHRRTKR